MTGLAALEARLKNLEDRQEITQLLAMHPLAIDSGDGDFWMSNWTKDSVMDRTLDPEAHSGQYEGVYGWDTMLTEIKGPELAASRKAGLMHFNTPPSIPRRR
jgi:SnoaL-like domain